MDIINYRYFCLNILDIVERTLNPYYEGDWSFIIDEQNNCEISCIIKTPHINTEFYITLKINVDSVRLYYGFGKLAVGQLEYNYDEYVDFGHKPNTNDEVFVRELKRQIPKSYAKTCIKFNDIISELLLSNLGDLVNDN